MKSVHNVCSHLYILKSGPPPWSAASAPPADRDAWDAFDECINCGVVRCERVGHGGSCWNGDVDCVYTIGDIQQNEHDRALELEWEALQARDSFHRGVRVQEERKSIPGSAASAHDK